MRSIYFDVSIPRIFATKAFSKITPSVFFSRISPIRYKELPDQTLPGPNWVRVKNILSGICGSDISMFFVQANPKISMAALPGLPRVFLGHEVIGQVIEAGSGVKDINLGDRVTLQRYLPCCSIKEIDPECNPCQEGNYPLCENFSKGKMPSNLGAGFSDHFIAHRSQLLKVPDEITNEQAVMLEPTSVSLHAVLKHPPKEGEKVLVIGAGSIGLNVIQIAKIVNPRCSVYVLERFELKKELSYKFGADYVLEGDIYKAVSEVTGGNLYMAPLKNNHILGGFDLIYDCVASSNTIHDSMRWLKAKGTYVMIGAQLKPATFDHTPIFHQELTIVGVNSHGNEKYLGKKISSFELAMEMILERKINLERFISHRFSLNKYREAFMLVKENPEKVVKVVFEIE